MASHWVVVPAAGIGQRMASQVPKQYLPLLGKPVIHQTLERLLAHPVIAGVVVVLREGDPYWDDVNIVSPKPLLTTLGGSERRDSVAAGLAYLADRLGDDDWVLVHDAVRPCVVAADLDRLFAALTDDPVGGLLALPVPDTLKRADSQGRVQATVDRHQLWRALTPQMFRYRLLCDALTHSHDADLPVTDEALAVEQLGFTPLLVPGSPSNLKITHPADLALAERLLDL